VPSNRLKTYFSGLTELFSTTAADEFELFVRALEEAHAGGAHIFICGNGGSAATASHFACDINKGVSYGRENRFKIICLNDNIPTLLAYANDLSYDDVFAEQLKNFMRKDDLVIALSGSGNSKNVVKAVEYANSHGGKSFGICGYGGGVLKRTAQASLIIHCDDMQKVEDMHLIVLHCAMQHFHHAPAHGRSRRAD
jgi:D-sedoheptulose 7-phosphate isomerase